MDFGGDSPGPVIAKGGWQLAPRRSYSTNPPPARSAALAAVCTGTCFVLFSIRYRRTARNGGLASGRHCLCCPGLYAGVAWLPPLEHLIAHMFSSVKLGHGNGADISVIAHLALPLRVDPRTGCHGDSGSEATGTRGVYPSPGPALLGVATRPSTWVEPLCGARAVTCGRNWQICAETSRSGQTDL
jgi:hypothetical protein